MKNYLFILLFVILGSCSRKTNIANNTQLETKANLKHDSSAYKTINAINKTRMFITKTVDTNLIVTGKTLSGYLGGQGFKTDTSAHFENEDLYVMLSVDKFGFASFIANPKPKKIPVKIYEHTEVYNDVATKEVNSFQTKASANEITNSKQKYSEKQTIPNANFWFIVGLISIAATVFIWVVRKLNILKTLA